MPSHRPDPRQADLFFAYLVDLPLRDQADTKALAKASITMAKPDLWRARLAVKTLRRDQREAIAAAAEN